MLAFIGTPFMFTVISLPCWIFDSSLSFAWSVSSAVGVSISAAWRVASSCLICCSCWRFISSAFISDNIIMSEGETITVSPLSLIATSDLSEASVLIVPSLFITVLPLTIYIGFEGSVFDAAINMFPLFLLVLLSMTLFDKDTFSSIMSRMP